MLPTYTEERERQEMPPVAKTCLCIGIAGGFVYLQAVNLYKIECSCPHDLKLPIDNSRDSQGLLVGILFFNDDSEM